jgi:secondary thiamine-phosphate synthase enzyme
MKELGIRTGKQWEVVDITDMVAKEVSGDGMVQLFVAHTTCALTTADLDPGMAEDMTEAFWQMIPKLGYQSHHDPEHAPAHILASLIGPSVSVPVKDGKLQLGTWQRIVLVEFDGPKERRLILDLISK